MDHHFRFPISSVLVLFALLNVYGCSSSDDSSSINVEPTLAGWTTPPVGTDFDYHLTIDGGTPTTYTMDCRKVETVNGRVIEHFFGNNYADYQVILEPGGDISVGDSIAAGSLQRFATGSAPSSQLLKDSSGERVIGYVGTTTLQVLGKQVSCLHVIDSTNVGFGVPTSIQSVNTWYDPEYGCAVRTVHTLIQGGIIQHTIVEDLFQMDK